MAKFSIGQEVKVLNAAFDLRGVVASKPAEASGLMWVDYLNPVGPPIWYDSFAFHDARTLSPLGPDDEPIRGTELHTNTHMVGLEGLQSEGQV